VWGIVKKFMNEGTVEKFQILGSNYRDALLSHIDAEALPKWLGGKFVDKYGDPECKSLVPPGGLIPQAFIAGRPTNADATPSTDPSYFGVAGDGHGLGEEVNIPSGKYNDVLIRVPAGATVNWRWASVDKDVGFRVTAVQASSDGVGPQCIDVTRSVAGVHLLPLLAAGAFKSTSSSMAAPSAPYTATTSGDIKGPIPFAAAGAAETEVVPFGKVDKHYGSWTAPPTTGPYLLRIRFDNSYSWVSSKTLVRRVDVLLPGHAFGTTPTITTTAATLAASTIPAILIEDDPLERYACGREQHLATYGTRENDVCWCPSVPKPPGA
jgi:CRAL/TRIO domain